MIHYLVHKAQDIKLASYWNIEPVRVPWLQYVQPGLSVKTVCVCVYMCASDPWYNLWLFPYIKLTDWLCNKNIECHLGGGNWIFLSLKHMSFIIQRVKFFIKYILFPKQFHNILPYSVVPVSLSVCCFVNYVSRVALGQ